MSPTELYEAVAGKFPAAWPQMPAWRWVNLHDGTAPRLHDIADLLTHNIDSPEVLVLVHAEPGFAIAMPKESAAAYIANHLLKQEIQVSDPQFTQFITISRAGVATPDA